MIVFSVETALAARKCHNCDGRISKNQKLIVAQANGGQFTQKANICSACIEKLVAALKGGTITTQNVPGFDQQGHPCFNLHPHKETW